MKKTNRLRKLSLARETLSNLNLRRVGGGALTDFGCTDKCVYSHDFCSGSCTFTCPTNDNCEPTYALGCQFTVL